MEGEGGREGGCMESINVTLHPEREEREERGEGGEGGEGRRGERERGGKRKLYKRLRVV